jgi:hypothetical protein
MDKEFSRKNAQYDDLLLDEYLKEEEIEEDDSWFSARNQEAMEEEAYYRSFGLAR